MITTFYSYKGGVGRSMALANVADLMARSGLQVLVVDFDLEAPGLEHFFPIDHERVRSQEGLLDLLLAFKHAMSVAADDSERDVFRDLDRYLTTVYPAREGSGGLDLLPAGRRSTAQDIVRYGAELRRFDWLDFYFTWSGELFFEWLRRTCAARYDAVLVDSRTGVTEMGGVCAYQLADAVVVLCAPNLQNVEGTDAMVRHFLSPDVRAVRGGRAVDVLIVPSRVDQADAHARASFESRFTERFDTFTPAALAEVGKTLWSLQIPYDSRYAFDEQVVADPSRVAERRSLAAAYGSLLEGIARLAPPDSRLSELTGSAQAAAHRIPVETRYDPTTRAAAPDVYLSAASPTAGARVVGEILQRHGLVLASAPAAEVGSLTRAWAESVRAARVALVLVDGDRVRSTTRARELDQVLARERPVLPVLLPGADPIDVPAGLEGLAYLDLRSGVDEERLLSSVGRALSTAETLNGATAAAQAVNPYPGLRHFVEADASVFYGREQLISHMVQQLDRTGLCVLVGSAGSGKTSTIRAGLVPAVRGAAVSGDAARQIMMLRISDSPVDDLNRAMDAVGAAAAPSGSVPLLIVDQAEGLFGSVHPGEGARFLAELLQLVRRRTADVVIVLRAEYLGEFLGIPVPTLPDAMAQALVFHGRLTVQELRDVIERPAAAAGLALEPGLADRIVADAGEGAEALALLQSVLSGLARDNADGYLTHRSYEALGGVLGALARRAESALEALTDEQVHLARVVLLRLVSVDELGTRRRLTPLADLVSNIERGQPGGHAAARDVVQMLAEAGLLTMEGVVGRVTVQLTHEALPSAWARLADWIASEHDALRARTQLAAAVEVWERLDRDPAELLDVTQVERLTSAADTLPLTAREEDFVKACHIAARRSRVQRRVSTTGAGVLGTTLGGAAVAFLTASTTGVSVVATALMITALTVAWQILAAWSTRRG